MGDRILVGRQILIVEDEYLLADDLVETLTAAGADIIGPIPSLDGAMALLDETARIDAAVLDINLRGDKVFPLAAALEARDIPFVFSTGYDAWAIPEQFADRPRIEKPIQGALLASTITSLLQPAA